MARAAGRYGHSLAVPPTACRHVADNPADTLSLKCLASVNPARAAVISSGVSRLPLAEARGRLSALNGDGPASAGPSF